VRPGRFERLTYRGKSNGVRSQASHPSQGPGEDVFVRIAPELRRIKDAVTALWLMSSEAEHLR